jgi:hypothetical protein
MRQLLPLGIQDFARIREDGFVYVTSDETLRLAIQNELKGFYSVLKSSGDYQQFLLLTGVTKFSKVSIFSDLNHLDDLTLSPRYADLCGITQEELERNFGPVIEEVLEKTGRNRDEYMGNLRQYYDGYRFSEKPLKVYNPYWILSAQTIPAPPTADEALAQIDTNEYLLPWTGSGKKLFKVGVNFDSEKRNIGDWKYTTVG